LTDTTEGAGFCNGYIGVVPFTQLQSPDSSAVQVNVYVSCPNLQVNGLQTYNLPISRAIPVESGAFGVGADNCSILQEISCLELNPSSADSTHISQDHFGEQPVSFRALMKRYVLSETQVVAADATALPKALVIESAIYPPSNAIAGNSGIVNWNLFDYLRYSYLGVRGGMRFRVCPNGSFTVNNYMWTTAGLVSPSTNPTPTVYYTSATGAELEGGVKFILATNGGVEFETPFYTNNLFLLPCTEGFAFQTSADNMCNYWYKMWYVEWDCGQTSMPTMLIRVERAVADDFSFLRFQGATLYSGTVIA